NWIEPFAYITKITPKEGFNDKWQRTIEIQPLKGKPMDSKQQVTFLSPHSVCVEASRFKWQAMYRPQELGTETIRQLLYSCPELKEKPGEVNPLKRTKSVKFFLQGAFYEAAEQELDTWLKESTGDKEKIDSLREALRMLRTQELLDEL